mgnify:CR=1 FL=1
MNIYDKLSEIISDEKYSSLYNAFQDKYIQELDTAKDKEIFTLLKNIASIGAIISFKNIEFSPRWVTQGERTYSIKDITENDYNLLLSLDAPKLPLSLKAHIADILWTQKKNYQFAKIAAEAYFKLYDLWFCDDWDMALYRLMRSICISIQTKNNGMCQKCYQSIYNHILELNGKDSDFLSLSLIEMLLEYSYEDTDALISVLDIIIASNYSNPIKTKKAYELKTKCYKNEKSSDKIKQEINTNLADYYVSYAESLEKSAPQAQVISRHYFEEAILLYRNNSNSTKIQSVHKKLIDIQKDISKKMEPITIQINTQSTIDNISKSMDGLSFCECVFKLTQAVNFYKKEDFKKRYLDDLESSPFISKIKKTVINTEGQPISKFDPEKDHQASNTYIHRMMHEYQKIEGTTVLRYYISYIKQHFNIDNADLGFLIDNNDIIPKGRENIIRSAIGMALKEQYYEALHILAPQTENIFRNIAESAGGLTETFESDMTSKKKVLSSIFKLPELKDCYDNDILFLFEGLLNERVGANIRNEIAHGIMNPSSANSGDKIYFICAFIKLLVLTSPQCQIILDECPN